MAELKKCPFCGGAVELHKGYVSYSIICMNCKYEVFNRQKADEVLKKWNNRATEIEIRNVAITEFAERLKANSIRGAFEYKPNKKEPWHKVRTFCRVVGTRKIDEIAEEMKKAGAE